MTNNIMNITMRMLLRSELFSFTPSITAPFSSVSRHSGRQMVDLSLSLHRSLHSCNVEDSVRQFGHLAHSYWFPSQEREDVESEEELQSYRHGSD